MTMTAKQGSQESCFDSNSLILVKAGLSMFDHSSIVLKHKSGKMWKTNNAFFLSIE